MDGANIEIREEIGEENMFIFGALTPEVEGKRKAVRLGENKWPKSFKEVIDFINTGKFLIFLILNLNLYAYLFLPILRIIIILLILFVTLSYL